MKQRLGFVSNSSSSSFICDVCGQDVSGWDLSLSESGMVECENGHTLCQEHIKEPSAEQLLKMLEDTKKYLSEWSAIEKIDEYITENELLENLSFESINSFIEEFGGESYIYALPEQLCPLCNFEEVPYTDFKDYLLRTADITIEEAFADIKSRNKRRKKIRPEEYVVYVCSKIGKTIDELLDEVETRFNGSYKEFKKFLRDK